MLQLPLGSFKRVETGTASQQSYSNDFSASHHFSRNTDPKRFRMLAKLKFLADIPLYDEEKPYTLYGFPDDIIPKSNCEFVVLDDIPVSDARGHEANFRLNECGFEVHHKPSSCDLRAQTFENVKGREQVWQYLKETIALAEETLEASKVLCFDWRVCCCGLYGY